MRIAVCGLGRAGKVLARKIIEDGRDELVCAICREESDIANQDVGTVLGMYELDIPVVPIPAAAGELVKRKADVVIDFSNKNTTLRMAKICAENYISMVVCTTNFEKEELLELKRIGETSEKGLIYAPNLTIGINLLMEFVERISKLLPDFDFEIIERHRKEKKKVTTTARLIAERIDRDNVPISAIRVGGYVGVHEVTAANENERLTIVHESFSRDAFANGALMAARYILGKSGYHEMSDVIQELEDKMMK
jgi:4-hydroxy-tetrahydrodipicolinate reductase